MSKNLTPFHWGPKATSRRPPQVELAVCVRGVFRLAPGQPLTAIEDPILQGYMSGEQWAERDPDRLGPSVRHDDFADWKPHADLLLRGTCHPPKGQDVVCDVAFGVGAWSKTLRVHGPRTYAPGLLFGGAVSEPQLFRSMPLTWENAYGGPGFADNPAGKGFAGPELPTVEDPRAPITKVGQAGARPASFLPVSSQWPARAGKRGTNYGKAWEQTRAPFVSDDFDWSYYQAAPPDQRLDGYLRGDEVVWFQHLHPAAPRFEVRLPGLRLRALVKRTDGTVHDLKLVLDTLLADTDAGRLELLWRGHCPVGQLDLSDVKVVLVASEPLAEAPKPGAHWLPELEAFEQDPVGIKAKLPPGFLQIADAVQAAEKAELEGTPRPDFAAVARGLPKDSPVPPWTVAALGCLDDPLALLKLAADAVGATLPADPAALAALAERVKAGGKDPAAHAEHIEALAAQLPPETAAQLRAAAAKLRATKAGPAPAGGDPAATLEALAAGLPAEAAGPLRAAAGKVRAAMTDARAAASPEVRAALDAAPPPAPAGPAPPLPAQLAAARARVATELAAAQAGAAAAPAAAAPAATAGRDVDAALAGVPASLEAGVAQALAPLAAITLPPAPDAGAVVAKVVAGLEAQEAVWRRRLGDHPLLGVFALAKRVAAGAGEKVTRAKAPDAGAVAGQLRKVGEALAGLGVSAAALAPLADLAGRFDAFGAALARRPAGPPRDLAGRDLTGHDFSGQDLAGRSLAGATLTGARLVGARLAGADLAGADLTEADLSGADLSGAGLRGARLPRARLVEAALEGADLGDADLAGADLSRARGRARLVGASLDGAVLEGAALAGSDLTGATLTKARLRGADLRGAVLEQVMAQKADLREATLAGARLALSHLGKADLRGADLSGADLAMASADKLQADGVNLRGASFDLGRLEGSRLRGADLREARASLGSLAGCDLTGADLRGLTFERSDLQGAVLEDTDLTGATLTQTNLRDVRATRATFVDVKARQASATGAATFEACDLRRLDAERSVWFGATLRGSDLSHAILSHALLQDLKATDTSFFAATMKRAVLRKAKLTRVRFVAADLGGAELVGAELLDVQFTRANLWDAKLMETTIASCDFLEAGLVRARFDRARGEHP